MGNARFSLRLAIPRWGPQRITRQPSAKQPKQLCLHSADSALWYLSFSNSRHRIGTAAVEAIVQSGGRVYCRSTQPWIELVLHWPIVEIVSLGVLWGTTGNQAPIRWRRSRQTC